MSDFIRREDAYREIMECLKNSDMPEEWENGMHRAGMIIEEDVPSADAVEVRHAEWQLIHKDKNFVKDIYQCSECRFLVTGTQEIAYVYCPNCGARMYHVCYCSYGERK